MNFVQEIIALFKVKNVIETEIKEAQTMTSGTPGWKTSEFWLGLGTQLVSVWGAVQGFIPAKYAAIISVVGTAVYTIARTAYKAYTEVKTATTTTAAPTTNTTVTVNP